MTANADCPLTATEKCTTSIVQVRNLKRSRVAAALHRPLQQVSAAPAAPACLPYAEAPQTAPRPAAPLCLIWPPVQLPAAALQRVPAAASRL